MSQTRLSPPESGELIEIDVHIMKDLTLVASPDVLTFVDGDNRRTTILVLPERMAPLLPDQPKSQVGKNCLQFTGGDGGETSHAGISSCWTPTSSKVGRDPPRISRWTSSHSSAASRIRRMAWSSDRPCVWHPASAGIDATEKPSSSRSRTTLNHRVFRVFFTLSDLLLVDGLAPFKVVHPRRHITLEPPCASTLEPPGCPNTSSILRGQALRVLWRPPPRAGRPFSTAQECVIERIPAPLQGSWWTHVSDRRPRREPLCEPPPLPRRDSEACKNSKVFRLNHIGQDELYLAVDPHSIGFTIRRSRIPTEEGCENNVGIEDNANAVAPDGHLPPPGLAIARDRFANLPNPPGPQLATVLANKPNSIPFPVAQ